MTDSYDSDSNEGSLSLLYDLSASQIKGAAEDMAITDFYLQVGNKAKEKEIHQLRSAEPGMPNSIQSTACCGESSRSANVSHYGKIPNKINLNKRNGKGETLLHKACKRKNLAKVRMLIHAGIRVDMEDYAGWTALHEASAVGDEAVVEELLMAGANVNARSCDGVTPLHDAVSHGHYQVVKLLLQYGSNANDRNVGDHSALDMADEKIMKELLLAFQASSVAHETSCQALQQYRQPGASSSEPHCHRELSCQNSFSPTHGDTVFLQSRASSDRDRARESSDIQLKKKGTTTDNVRYSEDTTMVLEMVRRKQTEMLTWPLTGVKDADIYYAALTQIQSVLTEVLTKQHLEKDNLAQKYWKMSDSLRQRVLKSQLLSLASCQRTLMEILQKQKNLVKVMLRDGPSSYHYLNEEVEVNALQRHLEDSVQHYRAGSWEVLTTEAASLMKIKVIHLVDDEELLPNAIMDYYWDKLVMKDYSESDWASELL